MKQSFRHQLWHLLSLFILIVSLQKLTSNSPGLMSGSLCGFETRTWFWLAIAIPIVHQVYVWLIWRLELYQKTFTSRYGLALFAAGCSILFVSRLIFILVLALSNRNSLPIDPAIVYTLATIITPLVLYLFYSVKRYFTIARAYGIDHFDKNDNEPYVKKGIFRFTDISTYIYGFMILYLPGLRLFSKAALLAALFNHIYIWVHYYCTERPDMQEIYGEVPGH